MAVQTEPPPVAPAPGRRGGELTWRELLRFGWRQLTSMRTALVLLLLLALAAVPGSVIPQEGVDALEASRWRDAHPRLTPVYERLGLFSVYDSVWFSAIYLLLMISLVGCIVPRTLTYWRAWRAQPPAAPRNLSRLPDSAAFVTAESPAEVLERARGVLRDRRYRLRRVEEPAAGTAADPAPVSAERGRLREAGNLLFHVSVVVVLVGFAIGGLFGYKGGVILVVGNTFSNTLTQYDDFVPGSLFDADRLEPFSFTVDDFDITWLTSGPAQGQARAFSADLRYRESPTSPERSYDLRVNHPLAIGATEVFLIGHGYAPVITVRDGTGEVAYSGPTVFLPRDQNFLSFGVVKAPYAEPTPIGLTGLFFPTYIKLGGDPVNVYGDLKNPTLSMSVYTGDLGLSSGEPQSVYVLDTAKARRLEADGKPYRLDLQEGQTAELPGGVGTVSFDGVQSWNRIQISQTPGKRIALAGVCLALLGLCLSLFVRPRRVWVRARATPDGTLVEVAALDRSGGGDVAAELDEVRRLIAGETGDDR